MDSTCDPRNDLEHCLLDGSAMEAFREYLARRVLDMQVFIPVRDEKHQIAGFQRSTQAEPMVLEDDAGRRALILFTAPERAKPFLAGFPEFSGGLLTEFSWVLRRIGEDMSVALNPGIDEGFDFDPHMIAMLATLLVDDEEPK